MKKLNSLEFKQIELGILQHIDEFCQQNDIRYSLAEGTLIGAVRHKGIIPWDDDVDVFMLREDFEKFIRLHSDTRYNIVQWGRGSTYSYSFIRLEDTKTEVVFENKDWHSLYNGGVWIDILPIDNFPDDKEEFHKTERKIYFYSNLYRLKTRKKWLRTVGFFRNIVWLLVKILTLPVSSLWLINKITNLMTRCNEQETSTKGFWTNYWHKPWVFPSTAFRGFTRLEFEGNMYSAIEGYDEYLRSEYGDYMKLPPVEKRVASHGFEAYMK